MVPAILLRSGWEWLSGPGEPARDFEMLGPAEHGVQNVVHLFGIESPGLTASLALADLCVARLLDGTESRYA